MQPASPPTELRLDQERSALRIAWSDGTQSALTAVALRLACRCAECTAQRAAGQPLAASPVLTIAAVEAIGNYAVTIAFTDGHARGVYPWAFLAELAAG